jgi:hypothetical protein
MRRLTVLASLALTLLALGPGAAGAGDRAAGKMPRPHHRPARPIARPHPILPCCLGGVYLPPAPSPVVVVPPPPVYLVVPSPPSLVHVPTPRVEPAPEITLPTGRWARHGNGREYPYVWVWVGPAAGQ